MVLDTIKECYCIVESSNKGMNNLGEFFTCDVGSTVDHWIDFLNDPDWPETQSNWCILEKDGDIVRIFDFLTEERYLPYPVPDDQVLKIKKTEFVRILYQWEEIAARDFWPRQIKITERRGVFNMEAID